MALYCLNLICSKYRTARFMKLTGLLIPALLVVSCAGDPANSANAGEVCEYVRVTGSNMPIKECRSPEERAAIAAREREAAEQGLRNQRDLDEFGVESVGAASLD